MNFKIALVIKTAGLEYDDRVRKEILSIQNYYPNITFKIFALLPENKAYEGVTDYGVPFRSVYVPAREKYPSSQKILLKAWQLQKAIEKELETYDAVWCANDDTAVTVVLTRNKRILWDLHEIPSTLVGSTLKRKVLSYLFSRCKVVIHANSKRKEYLESIGAINDDSRHFAIRNYPNFEDIDSEYDEKYNAFVKWKGERKCVYLQGLNFDRRAPFESISAVLAIPELCAVVVGGFDVAAKKRLEEQFGKELEQRVFFVGKINQMKIPQYVKLCYTTLVFYKNVSPNNFYCEANRFYQSVIMGLPVVVGCNPTMKELVEKYGFGIAIDDDGCDIEKIIDGIKLILENYDSFKKNIEQNKNVLLWENQKDDICSIVNKLLE